MTISEMIKVLSKHESQGFGDVEVYVNDSGEYEIKSEHSPDGNGNEELVYLNIVDLNPREMGRDI